MSKLEELIKEYCPNGVEYVKLGDIVDLHKGVQFNKTDMAKYGKYPVINGGIEPSGYIELFNEEEGTITISQGGASAGYVNWIKTKFWAGAHCYVIKPIDELQLSNRYLFHFIKNKENELKECQYGAGIPALGKETIKELQIPVPALPVQREIVRVLDSFTLYSAELTAELTARRKQYEFYRDKLLTFDTNVVWRKLEEIASFRRGSFPQPYTNEAFYGGEDSMPFVQVADVADRGFCLVDKTKQTISKLAQPKSIFVKKGTVICSLQGSIGRVAIVQYDCYVDRTLAIFDSFKFAINKKYFAYAIDRKFSYEKEFARGSTIKTITKEEFAKFEIPVPPIEVQERIVKVLDG